MMAGLPWLHRRGIQLESLAAALVMMLAAVAAQPGLMAQTPAPVIEKLSPTSGPAGTNVKIKGSNFGTSGTVTFNGTTASPSSWENDKIQARVPEGATTGPVVVTVGTQSSAGVTFTVTSPPTGLIISKLEPDSGPTGTEIKIKGLNFGENAGTVTFNGVSASPIAWNDKKIRVNVPATATTGPVVVTAGGETSNGVTFTVTTGVPVISKLEPDSGAVGEEIKIKGSNFGKQSGTVTFNGVSASPHHWNHQIIRAQVPQGATSGPVVVTVGSRSSNGVAFTVTGSDSNRDQDESEDESEPDPDDRDTDDTDSGDPDPEQEEPGLGNPADFSSSDLAGSSFILHGTRLDGSPERVTLLFGDANRFETSGSRAGSYDYRPIGPSTGALTLDYDDGGSCEVELSYDSVNSGASSFDCSGGGGGSGMFRLTAGASFVPVLLKAAGRNDSFFTSEMTLTNRGARTVKLTYTYTAYSGGGTGSASEVLPAGHQRVVPDALEHLRSLRVPIPVEGDRIGTLRVEAPVSSRVGVLVRTTTDVPDGRAGLAYPGIGMEAGFHRPVYLCGLRQNEQDRSNVAFQNMGAPEEASITLRTTVFSGDPDGPEPRVLEDKELQPGGFYQFSSVLGSLANGYVRVERVEGSAPFYAYGVINDQVNSDGSFVFPIEEGFPGGAAGQTLPVMVENPDFSSELMVANVSDRPRTLTLVFVADGIPTPDRSVRTRMLLEAGRQLVIPEATKLVRSQGQAGMGSTSGNPAGPLFVTEADGDLEGVVVGARTVTPALVAGGRYGVFYNAVPYGSGFREVAWVEGLQQNRESRTNLALVNTGEVDESESVFNIDIYDGDTGLMVTTITGRTVPARGWRQLNSILRNYAQGTTQGYVRIRKISGNNPFLAYGVINDGGSRGERSGDGAYIPARE